MTKTTTIRITDRAHRYLSRIRAATGEEVQRLVERLAAQEWGVVGADHIAALHADLEAAARGEITTAPRPPGP